MMRLIYNDEATLLPWAAAKVGNPQLTGFDPRAVAIGIAREEEIAAVAVYYHFEGNDCRISLASDGSRRWMTREFVTHVFAYPFIQLHLDRITAEIPRDRIEAARLCGRFGFIIEGTKRGTNTMIFGLLRTECRWLGPRAMAAAA